MNFQIDGCLEHPAQWVKAYPLCGTGAYQSESREQWGQREDSIDFQRGKHDSCNWSRFLQMMLDFSAEMMEARRGDMPYNFRTKRTFHPGVLHPFTIS